MSVIPCQECIHVLAHRAKHSDLGSEEWCGFGILECDDLIEKENESEPQRQIPHNDG